MGCQVVLEFYHRYPHRTQALVPILGSFGRPADTFLDSWVGPAIFRTAYAIGTRMPKLVGMGLRASLRQPLTWQMTRRSGLVHPDLARKEDVDPYLEHMARLDPRVFLEFVRAAQAHDAGPLLSDIDVPTLVVAGERDLFTPRHLSVEMAGRIPRAELLEIPCGSHAALIEQPELINLRMEKFIRENVTPKPTPSSGGKRPPPSPPSWYGALSGLPSRDQPAPGERYEILGRIAVGGMAEIYLAKDVPHNRQIVLKRLMPGLQSDPEFVRMFYDEANIAARLRHPNIVTIHELGELDGSLFIAMECLEGVNLRELLIRLEAAGRALPVGLAILVAIDALTALDYAHRYTDKFDRSLKVVHRDVSPQNIILTYDGQAKLLDFGVAKAEGRLHQTRAGLIKGKFSYMSPEQLSGGALDGRSDLFALGEVLYELLLRRHPFYAEAEMDMLRAVLDDNPPHPSQVDPQIPAALANVVLRSLHKLPEDRYGTAGLMKKDLEHVAAQSGISLNRGLLARFVQDLFRERLSRLQQARATGDIDALVQAMRVLDAAPAQRPAVNQPLVAPDEPSRYLAPESNPVVEVASGGTAPADPAETIAPGDARQFIAHGGANTPSRGAQRYQKSDVFEAPKLDSPTIRQVRKTAAQEDSAELPTVMGHLSRDEMAQLREAAAQVRSSGFVSEDVDPASEPAVVIADPAEGKAPRGQPTARATPQAGAAKGPLSPRSRTVVPDGDAPPPPDRNGLILFGVGVAALLAAVAYATYLFWGSGAP